MAKTVTEVLRERFAGEESVVGTLENTIGTGFAVPPRLKGESEFHWFHPPLQGARYLTVLSADVTWYAGHYSQGRMRLCQSESCEMCLLQVGRQVRYVVCAVDLESREVGFLEVGIAGGEVLRRAVEDCGTLRGVVLSLSRLSRKKNSRIEMGVVHEVAPPWSLEISPLNVQAALFQTWSRAGVQKRE